MHQYQLKALRVKEAILQSFSLGDMLFQCLFTQLLGLAACCNAQASYILDTVRRLKRLSGAPVYTAAVGRYFSHGSSCPSSSRRSSCLALVALAYPASALMPENSVIKAGAMQMMAQIIPWVRSSLQVKIWNQWCQCSQFFLDRAVVIFTHQIRSRRNFL